RHRLPGGAHASRPGRRGRAAARPARRPRHALRPGCPARRHQPRRGRLRSRRSALRLEPRYYRLAEVCDARLQPGVAGRTARARTLGVAPVPCRGDYNPVETLGPVMADADDPDTGSDWWRRVMHAGTRPDCTLADPYPPGGHRDGSVPIDAALDALDAT